MFKALKQSCKIKTFVGTSANAVKTQVWTALIAMLLLRYLQLKAHFGWALANLLALLRQQLFVHRDLWQWLDQPFQRPPAPLPDQLALSLTLNLDSRASHSHVNFGGDADQSSRNLDSILNFPNRSPNLGTPT